MFGRVKPQQINEKNRGKILGLIDSCRRICANMDLGTSLSSARNLIDSSPASASKEAIRYDAPVLRYLQAIYVDIQSKSYRVASIRMEILEKILGERSSMDIGFNNPFSTKKDLRIAARADKELNKWYKKNLDDLAATFNVDELYRPEEIYRLNIAGLQDTIDRENAELQKLLGKLANNPGDDYIASQAEVVQERINGLKEQIGIYKDERIRNTYLQSIINAPATQRALIAERPYSDEVAEIAMQEYEKFKAQKGKDPVLIHREQNRGNSGQNASAASFGGSAAGQQSSGAYGDVGRIQNAATAQAQRQKEVQELQQAVKLLERNEERFKQMLEENAVALSEVDAELKRLLERRKTLTASQRLTTDGNIDSLNAKRNRIIQAVNQINQARSINTDKLTMISNKKGLKETLATGVLNVGSVDYDFEQIALDLKEAAERGNDELDRIGTAYIVSQSVDIRSGAMSGTNQVDSAMGIETDDAKYAGLQKALGMQE